MKPEKFLACLFLGVIISVMISIPVKAVIINVNKFLEPEKKININWAKLYPYESSADNAPPPVIEKNAYSIIKIIKDQIDKRTSEALPKYYSFVETAKLYEKLIHWDIDYIGNYNAVIKLSDGYLTTFVQSGDVSNDAGAITGLSEYCNAMGIIFATSMTPTKYACMKIKMFPEFLTSQTRTLIIFLSCSLRIILNITTSERLYMMKA